MRGYNLHSATEMLERNGFKVTINYGKDGQVKSRRIRSRRVAGIKVLGALDYMIKYHKFQRVG